MLPAWTGILGAGAIVAAAVSPVMSAEFKGSGTVTYVMVDTDTVKFASGSSKQRINMKGVIVADDPSNPIHLSAQDCAGSLVVGPDGAPLDGGGYCEATDKDGEVWWLSWSDANANGNTWAILGGTGKYAGMTGRGTVTVLMQSGDGRLVYRWNGAFAMK